MSRKYYHEQKKYTWWKLSNTLFQCWCKIYIFRKIDVSTLKINHEEFSWSALLYTSPPNTSFSSQRIKLKFDGKLMWIPSIVSRRHESVYEAKEISELIVFAQSTCWPSILYPDEFACSYLSSWYGRTPKICNHSIRRKDWHFLKNRQVDPQYIIWTSFHSQN